MEIFTVENNRLYVLGIPDLSAQFIYAYSIIPNEERGFSFSYLNSFCQKSPSFVWFNRVLHCQRIVTLLKPLHRKVLSNLLFVVLLLF